MSPQWIEVDDDVMAIVKGQAEPFVDSPNDALRQLLGLGPASEATCAPLPTVRPAHGSTRAKVGELMPMAAYELALLRALSQLGGSASKATVKNVVKGMLADQLTPADYGRLRNGEERWSNRLGFARLRAVERGHLRSGSRRGVWELADAGIDRLGQLEAELQERERGSE